MLPNLPRLSQLRFDLKDMLRKRYLSDAETFFRRCKVWPERIVPGVSRVVTAIALGLSLIPPLKCRESQNIRAPGGAAT
jgi:hypothetical protein